MTATATRTVTLKAENDGSLRVSPGAKPGKQTFDRGTARGRVVMAYAITNVPADASDQDVARLAGTTSFMRTFGLDDANAEQCTYDYTELGVGKIIR